MFGWSRDIIPSKVCWSRDMIQSSCLWLKKMKKLKANYISIRSTLTKYLFQKYKHLFHSSDMSFIYNVQIRLFIYLKIHNPSNTT